MNLIKTKEKEQLIKSKLNKESTVQKIVDTYLEVEGVLNYTSDELLRLVKTASKLYGEINTALQLEFDGTYNSMGREGKRLFVENSFRSENGGFIQIVAETDVTLWLVFKVTKKSPISYYKEIDIIGVAISEIREDSSLWEFLNDGNVKRGLNESTKFIFTSNLDGEHEIEFAQRAEFGFFEYIESEVSVDGYKVAVTESLKY